MHTAPIGVGIVGTSRISDLQAIEYLANPAARIVALVAPRAHNPGRNATVHLNQKSLEFMRRIVKTASHEDDTIREPFDGLCTASLAAAETGRNAFAAEPGPYFSSRARQRLTGYSAGDQLQM